MFHQIDGLAVDEGITLSDLRGTLTTFAQRMFGSELAEYFDEQHGIYRAAALAGDQVEACLFIAPADAAPTSKPVQKQDSRR